MPDILDQLWACMNCTTKFRLGQGIPLSGNSLKCPICASTETHPADGSTVTLAEYVGPRGTKN